MEGDRAERVKRHENTPMLKLTLLLVSSLTIMSIITISPALPGMTNAFSHIPNADFLVKLILTVPALLIALSSSFVGLLIDKYGRLKFLYVALVLYAAAGTSGFWLDNIYLILAGRALLGLAVGITMTIVITLIADYFEGPARQKFLGIQVAFMSLGGIVFVGVGGVLADVGWRYTFLIYFLSLLILPLALTYLNEPDRKLHEVVKNDRKKSPSIIWLLFVNTMIMWILFFMIPAQLPFQMKSIGVERNALIGLAIAMSTAFSVISSFNYSRIKDRISFKFVFAIGYFLMAISFGLVSVADSYWLMVVAMALSGLGLGMMIPNTNNWVMQIAPPEIRGREIGRLTTFWFLGQFLSPIIVQPLAQNWSLSSLFLVASLILLLLSVFFGVYRFKKN